MTWLLDTNAWVQFLRGDPALTQRLLQTPPLEIGLSAVALEELFAGAYRSLSAEALAAVDSVASIYPIIDFDLYCAREAGCFKHL